MSILRILNRFLTLITIILFLLLMYNLFFLMKLWRTIFRKGSLLQIQISLRRSNHTSHRRSIHRRLPSTSNSRSNHPWYSHRPERGTSSNSRRHTLGLISLNLIIANECSIISNTADVFALNIIIFYKILSINYSLSQVISRLFEAWPL